MNKQIIYRWLTAITLVGGLLLWSLASNAQERIDSWYGKEMTLLHSELRNDAERFGDKFKYKNYGNGKHSLTMTDFRGVKCEYISLDFGYTVKYRIDHYSKKEYEDRKETIIARWEFDAGFYVLKNTVVSLFDDKKHRIGFALVRDMPQFSHMFGSSTNQDNLRLLDK